MADLHLDAQALDDAATQVLPRLPGLEQLLRLADVGPAVAGWRAALADELGLRPWSAVAPARLAAVALPEGAGLHPWFATPVHRVAALDHLRLHPAGLLSLPAAQLHALAQDFDRHFGVAGLRLHPLCGGFLLSGFAALGVVAEEPAAHLGTRLPRALARGEDAAALLRLSGECELWLHDHPVNRARSASGLLPVNGLWLWGGSADDAPLPGRPELPLQVRVFSDQAYALGLCLLAGGEAMPVPRGLDELLEPSADAAGCDALVVLDSTLHSRADAPLARLDRDWFQPALQALQQGRLAALTVVVAGRRCTLRRWHGLRRWRRLQPWWQQLC